MTYQTARINDTNNTREEFINGRDAKGRAEGIRVITFECDFVPADVTKHNYFDRKPGHYYAAQVQKTKNGRPFGASKPYKYFDTRVERNAYAYDRKRKAGII